LTTEEFTAQAVRGTDSPDSNPHGELGIVQAVIIYGWCLWQHENNLKCCIRPNEYVLFFKKRKSGVQEKSL